MKEVAAIPTEAKAKPTSRAPREGEDHPRRDDETEHEHDDEEADSVEAAADQRPDQLADRDVARRERCRQDRDEGLVVVQLEEEVERALVDRPVHRRAGKQRRRDEQLVRDLLATRPCDRADKRPIPKPTPSR
jgi:hypothetical protein